MSTNAPNTNEPRSTPPIPKSPTVASIVNGFQRVRAAFSPGRSPAAVDRIREDEEGTDRARRNEATANLAYVRKTSVGISACTHPDYSAQKRAEELALAERRAEDAKVIAISDAIPAGQDPDENTKYTYCDVGGVDTGSMGSGSSDKVIELKRLDAIANERRDSATVAVATPLTITSVDLPARPRPVRTKQVHFRNSIVGVDNAPIRLRSTDSAYGATMSQAEAGTGLLIQRASSPSWWNLAARVCVIPTEVFVKRLYFFGYLCPFLWIFGAVYGYPRGKPSSLTRLEDLQDSSGAEDRNKRRGIVRDYSVKCILAALVFFCPMLLYVPLGTALGFALA